MYRVVFGANASSIAHAFLQAINHQHHFPPCVQLGVTSHYAVRVRLNLAVTGS